MSRFRRALAVSFAALLVYAPAAAAQASPSEGSVPSEVKRYVADGTLVAQLADVYGPGAAGAGVDFDETTKVGTIERVLVFTAAFRAGEQTDHPIELLNEWIVPITIDGDPVGLATIWINPDTVLPELASFVEDPDLATALSDVPAGDSLVRDDVSRAWLALDDEGILTPLVPGTTGLSTPVPVDDIAVLPADDDGSAVAAGDPNTGVGFAIAVIVLLLAVIVVALVVPALRRSTDTEAGADESGDTDEAPDADDPTLP